MKTKISYYLSHPIQYFSPLLKLMADEFDLHVYYFSDASIRGNMDVGFNQKVKWDIPLLEGYSYTFLKNISKRESLSNRMWDVINPSVIRTLYKSKSKIVIINGWSYFSNLLIILFAKLFGKKVWLRAENPWNQEVQKSKKSLFLKKIVLKYFLFPFINKFLYIGKENKIFFEIYGAPSAKLIFTPYSVDNELFTKISNQNSEKKSSLSKELNLPNDKIIILFTGKFIEKKRPLDLIRAFYLLASPNAILVMVGEGKLRSEIENFVADNKVENVILTGFVNQSAITNYYSVADIFVMCSGMGETWGLSVNEAMCFSLPVIVSSTCGCSADLVREEENGFTFPEGDIEKLAGAISKLLSDEVARKKMGSASLEIVKNFSNKHIVENMKMAIG
ncbi:MAG TPA: glycosyltransferase family 4 protein [Hanamia sp.]|nr:glycosyltransferase family 4 protein [Hanamia sp.]